MPAFKGMMHTEEYVLLGGDTISEDSILLLPMRLNEDHLVE